MAQTPDSPPDEDRLTFIAESDIFPDPAAPSPPRFKLIIVDDDNDIHVMTRLVLSDYMFQGSALAFYSAYSGKEARNLVKNHPDAACMLLDVVMETQEAGLAVARYIREEEKNDKMRIILRTGQPGKAPEKEIILNYDINDYKEKTELTSQKLFTTITTALRSFIHLTELEKKTREIADKNIRLNEEIARRIVAESNLTKYNRSLEKMLDSKSARLKTAILELKKKETELREGNRLSGIGSISQANMGQLGLSRDTLRQNLARVDHCLRHMTRLLEKYETLQLLIAMGIQSSLDLEKTDPETKTREILKDIDQFKQSVDLKKILDQYPEIIRDSTEGIEHISRAVNDIRLFMAITDEPPTGTDINGILKTVADDLKGVSGPRIDLQTDLDELPEMFLTGKNLKAAFHEVVKNAFEAIQARGIVSISTLYDESGATVLISDVGVGIPAENLDLIFKPYFSAHKPGAKGLGLTFARSVVLNNSGTIEVTSTPKEGTTVTIIFPLKTGGDR